MLRCMSRRRFVRAPLALALAGLVGAAPPLLPTAARAASTAAATSAQEWYKVGVVHYEAKRYERAALAFDEAYALDPDPMLLWNAGRAWQLAGRPELAKARFTALLARAEAEAALRAKAAEALSQAEAALEARRLAELEAQRAAALKAQSEQRAEDERLRREEEEAKLAAAEARLREQLREEMRAELERAMAERKPERSAPSERVVFVQLPAAGEALFGRASRPASSASTGFGWAAVTLGVVAAGAGGGLMWWADSLREDVRSADVSESGLVTSLTQAEAVERERDANTFATLGIAGLAAGGAALLTGVILLATAGDDDEPATTLGVAPLGGGAVVTSGWSF